MKEVFLERIPYCPPLNNYLDDQKQKGLNRMIPIELFDECRKDETKEERRKRRRADMNYILEAEARVNQPIKFDSKRQKALLQLVGKARQGRYSNEQIGKLFRDIFIDM